MADPHEIRRWLDDPGLKEPEAVGIDNWCVHGGSIMGTLPCGKNVRTSAVVSRLNDLIYTRSGSLYRLLGENPSRERDKWLSQLDRCIAGAGLES